MNLRQAAMQRPSIGLAPATIYLWLCKQDPNGPPWLLRRCHHLLDPDERARARTFRGALQRTQYVLSHGWLRRVLSRHAPLAPGAWEFETDALGRPGLAAHCQPDAGELWFNLSHTHGLSAVAVTGHGRIGVDVEWLQRPQRPGAWHRALADTELQALDALPAPQRQQRFLELWTLKESYCKALGMGLRLPARAVAFDLHDRDIVARLPANDTSPSSRWAFVQWRIGASHVVSVCVEASGNLAWQARQGIALAWDQPLSQAPARRTWSQWTLS